MGKKNNTSRSLVNIADYEYSSTSFTSTLRLYGSFWLWSLLRTFANPPTLDLLGYKSLNIANGSIGEPSLRNHMVSTMSSTTIQNLPANHSNSASRRHGPTNRHVLLRNRPPYPRRPPHGWFQGPLPHFFHPQRISHADRAICPHRGRGRRRRRRRPDLQIRPTNPLSIKSLLPPNALRDELLLERRINRLRCRHHCHHLYGPGKCGFHGKYFNLQGCLGNASSD